jgi:PIN domain nuclease of toxin-antitoxin system
MNLLLDTHILLWWLADDKRLPKAVVETIAATNGSIFVSVASVWEIAIKVAQNRIKVDPDILLDGIAQSGFQLLPITAQHALQTAHLPLYHRDPFDRMLVAQAQVEPLHLLTHDAALRPYGDAILVV